LTVELRSKKEEDFCVFYQVTSKWVRGSQREEKGGTRLHKEPPKRIKINVYGKRTRQVQLYLLKIKGGEEMRKNFN